MQTKSISLRLPGNGNTAPCQSWFEKQPYTFFRPHLCHALSLTLRHALSLTLLQPHWLPFWPPSCLENTLSTVPPQGLCTAASTLCLKYSSRPSHSSLPFPLLPFSFSNPAPISVSHRRILTPSLTTLRPPSLLLIHSWVVLGYVCCFLEHCHATCCIMSCIYCFSSH